jgi:hypothetical protein
MAGILAEMVLALKPYICAARQIREFGHYGVITTQTDFVKRSALVRESGLEYVQTMSQDG